MKLIIFFLLFTPFFSFSQQYPKIDNDSSAKKLFIKASSGKHQYIKLYTPIHKNEYKCEIGISEDYMQINGFKLYIDSPIRFTHSEMKYDGHSRICTFFFFDVIIMEYYYGGIITVIGDEIIEAEVTISGNFYFLFTNNQLYHGNN